MSAVRRLVTLLPGLTIASAFAQPTLRPLPPLLRSSAGSKWFYFGFCGTR